jgi:regulatory protein YycI of two-component signal transduction system YycFG
MADSLCKAFTLIVLLSSISLSQKLTNFEIIDSLLNSIVDEISEKMNTESIVIQSNLNDKLVENRILNAFSKNLTFFSTTRIKLTSSELMDLKARFLTSVRAGAS